MKDELTPRAPDEKLGSIIKLAIMSVGGQGGGVLTGWVERLARAQGYACQATSVAGVAQRTGATIYYVEMAPSSGRQPIFSLAPAGGDVDVLIAAELIEAGRAIMRGFVTPDRTTLIASTHRALAVSEKMVPGDGIAEPDDVMEAARLMSDRLIALDMEALAVENSSAISATLFGALAASDALPFPRAAFEDAIRSAGKGVEPSLRAFAAAFEHAMGKTDTEKPVLEPDIHPTLRGPEDLLADWNTLVSRTETLPPAAQEMARVGLQKVVDFIDLGYGRDYLDRLEQIASDDPNGALTREAAKYLANSMAYDDVTQVADLKTRAPRRQRIETEMGTAEGGVMQVTEFLHPRAEEIVGLFPARVGAWAEARPGVMWVIDRLFNRGRRMRSDRMIPFAMLYLLGGLRAYRRRTHRHAIEMAHIDHWLGTALNQSDRALSIELLRCRRLIKGYSDTHARGLSKFDRVIGALDLLKGREDAADWIARLRQAALQDEDGNALDGAIKTFGTFAEA
ncbi:indolepyruvate oxidoreductase subunit beta family protein [Halovulum sp. GXIMD14793]